VGLTEATSRDHTASVLCLLVEPLPPDGKLDASGESCREGRMLLVHNSMLKPSRSIKMLTFMLLAAVGRLNGDKRLEERRRNCCKGCCHRCRSQ